MAALEELEEFTAEIFRIETDTVWKGGVDGPANYQGMSLANRTKWLKAQLLALGSASALGASVDGTLAANSDAVVPTQKAVKTYVDGLLSANDAMVFKGIIDCSANPDYPAADRGHTYRVSVAGKIGGAAGPNIEAGDILICITDGTGAGTHAGVGADWGIIQVNIDGALTISDIGVAVQAYDVTLTALAALVTAADKLIYATGADAFATTTLSAYARTLLADADAATMRATLGAIGATYSLGPSGYIIFPVWLAGGLVIQWGSGSPSSTNGENYLLPVAFPNAFWHVFTTSKGSAAAVNTIGNTPSLTQVFLASSVAGSLISYLAIGN